MQYPQTEFFAVSCDDHFDVCKEFGVESFPTLKVFQGREKVGIEITNHDTGYTVDLIASKLGLRRSSASTDRKLQERPEFNESPIHIEVEYNGRDDEDEYSDENVGDLFDDEEEDHNYFDAGMDEDSASQSDVGTDTDSADASIGEDADNGTPQSISQESTEFSGRNSEKDSFDASMTAENDSPEDESRDDSDESNQAAIEIPKHPSGGAMIARYKQKELDRFGEDIKRNMVRQRKGLDKLLQDRFKARQGTGPEPLDPDSLTKGMRMSTPGTEEFIKRRKAMMERLAKARNRGIMLTKPLQSADSLGAMELGSLPYHKDIRHPRRFGKLNPFSKLSEEEQLILDVTNAFYMGLKMGLFLKNDRLSPPQIIAFRNYLELLSVSLPPEWRLHKLISDLRRNFVKVGQSRKALYEILEKYPIQVGWSKDCLSGGFSCGFWKLLHTATVGLAEHRGGLNLIDSQLIIPSTKTFSPMEAADTIRDYIDHFFTCGPCRDEFIKNYDYCDNNRRCDRLTDGLQTATIADWKELATWLWEVHNEVSVRLVNTRAKKMHDGLPTKKEVVVPVADEIKALWPQYNDCVRCLKEDGRWDEAEVFAYLEKKYW